MIENLFSSKVMFLVLETLFRQSGEALSTSEIIDRTGRHQTSVMRELEKLAGWKLVVKSRTGNQNFFRLNTESPSFAPLKALFDESAKLSGRYFLFLEEGGVSLLSLNYFTRGYTSDYGAQKGIISSVSDVISHYQDNYGRFYLERATFEKGAKESFARLLADPSFVGDVIFSETIAQGGQALEIFQKLKTKGFRLSKSQAVNMLKKFEDIIVRQISLNYIAVFDVKDQPYSKYLEKYLNDKIAGTDLKLQVVLNQLLAPDMQTYTQRLRADMLALAIKCRIDKQDHATDLRRIWQDWLWLNFGYRGPAYDIGHFRQMFDELCGKSLAELRREAADLEAYPAAIRREKERLFSELGVDAKHRNFINALSLLSFLKVYRKDTSFLLIFMTYEILKRFNRTIRQDSLHYLTLDEAALLIDGKLKMSRSELRKREHDSVHLAREERILFGQEADAFIDRMVEKEEAPMASSGQIRILEGMTACLGRTGDWVRGKVKIVNKPEDMAKMEAGDILVSAATTPDILSAMKKASAIVTDSGGITCHAAIVSRELNVPCLIATKYATKVFKDGDEVIVCPRHGYIKFQ